MTDPVSCAAREPRGGVAASTASPGSAVAARASPAISKSPRRVREALGRRSLESPPVCRFMSLVLLLAQQNRPAAHSPGFAVAKKLREAFRWHLKIGLISGQACLV